MTQIQDLLARWNSPEGHPYKGQLIDRGAYDDNPGDIGCMCAQGQVLHLLGGWSPERLMDTRQPEADAESARLLNISRVHAVLLRQVNDSVDGAPAIVIKQPEKVLGVHARQVIAFWLALDGFSAEQWAAAWDAARAAARAAAGAAAWDAARAAAGAAARDAARAAARAAAGAAAWDAARAAAWDAAWDAARAAAWDAAGAAAGASNEIQGQDVMRERGHPFFFLPLFGFADSESIPALPADYGAPS
jgi:hypothetical protein